MDAFDQLIFASSKQQELFKKIQADFPNFPANLIYHWLLPFADADELGWPPDFDSDEAKDYRWKNILKYQLCDWRTVSWELQELDPVTLQFSESSLKGFHDLLLHGMGKPTMLGLFLGESSVKRFWQQVYAILSIGSYYEPPALLRLNDKLECVDGNHRMAAMSLVLSAPEVRFAHERNGWESVPLSKTHRFWIGTPKAGVRGFLRKD